MGDIDWNAPLNDTGEVRRAAFLTALGVRAPCLDELISTLHAEISSDDWGFGRLGDVPDGEQRALVSDQLLSAVDGVRDALVEAAVAVRDCEQATGPTGLPYREADESLNDMLRYERLRTSIKQFFEATSTALDCLAAVLVVVTRAPMSVQRADYTHLTGLDPDAAHARAFAAPVPDAQRDRWRDLLAELAARAADGPRDWLPWSLEMRNALAHRGRVTNVYMPRPISGRIAVPPTNRPQSLYRYDQHLRRRPWLPEIEAMLAASGLPNTWLDEPAGRTIARLLAALVQFCDAMSRWAAQAWASPPPDVVAPLARWTLPNRPQIDFDGVAPGGTVGIAGAIGGVNTEHLRLAERLRRHRSESS